MEVGSSQIQVPESAQIVLKKLNEAGFNAYLVGGCVRDVQLGRPPHDWDITTNALPEQIQEVFPENFYTNKFGTVSVKLGIEDLVINIQSEPLKLSVRPAPFNSVIRITPGQKLRVCSGDAYRKVIEDAIAIMQAKYVEPSRNMGNNERLPRMTFFDTPGWRSKKMRYHFTQNKLVPNL